MPPIELRSRVKCNAVLYRGHGWRKGSFVTDCDKNGLLKKFHLKPTFTVDVENTAIKVFRGGTRPSLWRNISVWRKDRWEQMCYIVYPELYLLNVHTTYYENETIFYAYLLTSCVGTAF